MEYRFSASFSSEIGEIVYSDPIQAASMVRSIFLDNLKTFGRSPSILISRFLCNSKQISEDEFKILGKRGRIESVSWWDSDKVEWSTSSNILNRFVILGDGDPEVLYDDLLPRTRVNEVRSNPPQELPDKTFTKIEIPKRSGGTRKIISPGKKWKTELKSYLPKLNGFKYPSHVHGFVPMRSPITNAIQHIGFDITISMDLKDFFDSVTASIHLKGKVQKEIMERCLIDGHPSQGLPTSPAIANIAALKMDERIKEYISKVGIESVYTRYADDLSISLKGRVVKKVLRDIIKKIVIIIKQNHFFVNEKKTKIQYDSSGGREICGVLVGRDGIRPIGRHKKKIRALEHIGIKHPNDSFLSKNTLRGMKEWCKFKIGVPRSEEEKQEDVKQIERYKDANIICKAYGIVKISPCEKKFQGMTIGEEFAITNDPVQMVCMSAAGEGWTSCMDIVSSTHKQVRKGVVFWQRLKGVSLAVIWGKGYKNIAGVEVRKVAARCLIYALKDGSKCYGRCYGFPESAGGKRELLAKTLKEIGFVFANGKKGERVVGNVQKSIWPYFDNSKKVEIKIKGKKFYSVVISNGPEFSI